jgi:hypothetical protein
MPSKNMMSCNLHLEMAAEVVRRDEILERDGDRRIEAAEFGGTEHGALPGTRRFRKGAQIIALLAGILQG